MSTSEGERKKRKTKATIVKREREREWSYEVVVPRRRRLAGSSSATEAASTVTTWCSGTVAAAVVGDASCGESLPWYSTCTRVSSSSVLYLTVAICPPLLLFASFIFSDPSFSSKLATTSPSEELTVMHLPSTLSSLDFFSLSQSTMISAVSAASSLVSTGETIYRSKWRSVCLCMCSSRGECVKEI